MLPGDLKQDIKSRMASLRGQMDGIIKMLDDEKDPQKIINQFKALDKGLLAAYKLLLDDVYRKTLAIKIVEVAEACPGNCGNEGKIEFIKNQFPHLQLDEIIENLKEIDSIGEKIKEYKKNEL